MFFEGTILCSLYDPSSVYFRMAVYTYVYIYICVMYRGPKYRHWVLMVQVPLCVEVWLQTSFQLLSEPI